MRQRKIVLLQLLFWPIFVVYSPVLKIYDRPQTKITKISFPRTKSVNELVGLFCFTSSLVPPRRLWSPWLWWPYSILRTRVYSPARHHSKTLIFPDIFLYSYLKTSYPIKAYCWSNFFSIPFSIITDWVLAWGYPDGGQVTESWSKEWWKCTPLVPRGSFLNSLISTGHPGDWWNQGN